MHLFSLGGNGRRNGDADRDAAAANVTHSFPWEEMGDELPRITHKFWRRPEYSSWAFGAWKSDPVAELA
jgi:hypothetical protein